MLNDVDKTRRYEQASPTLDSGDRMTQPEFHRIYEKMPKGFKAELVGGVVFVPSPLRISHGESDNNLGTVLGTYKSETPGVQVLQNSTVILGEEDEPQPDESLRIRPEYGGQSRTTPDDYVDGPPELHGEIATSGKSLDLHGKRERYRAAGVKEYLVLNLQDEHLHWFDLTTNTELQPDADGIYRIRNFPGLWIDGAALIAGDLKRLLAVLQQGLASPEHAAFVAKLAAAHAEYKATSRQS